MVEVDHLFYGTMQYVKIALPTILRKNLHRSILLVKENWGLVLLLLPNFPNTRQYQEISERLIITMRELF